MFPEATRGLPVDGSFSRQFSSAFLRFFRHATSPLSELDRTPQPMLRAVVPHQLAAATDHCRSLNMASHWFLPLPAAFFGVNKSFSLGTNCLVAGLKGMTW